MPLNEELLSKFTTNEFGDLYFEDKLIVKKDQVAPDAPTNARYTCTDTVITVEFDASVSTDVVKYLVQYENADTYQQFNLNITDTSFNIEGFSPYASATVSIYACDASGNKSDALRKSVMLVPPSAKPSLDYVNLQWGTGTKDGVYGIYLWPEYFVNTVEFDMYANGNLICEHRDPNNYGIIFIPSTVVGDMVQIKIVGRNVNGESTRIGNWIFS